MSARTYARDIPRPAFKAPPLLPAQVAKKAADVVLVRRRLPDAEEEKRSKLRSVEDLPDGERVVDQMHTYFRAVADEVARALFVKIAEAYRAAQDDIEKTQREHLDATTQKEAAEIQFFESMKQAAVMRATKTDS